MEIKSKSLIFILLMLLIYLISGKVFADSLSMPMDLKKLHPFESANDSEEWVKDKLFPTIIKSNQCVLCEEFPTTQNGLIKLTPKSRYAMEISFKFKKLWWDKDTALSGRDLLFTWTMAQQLDGRAPNTYAFHHISKVVLNRMDPSIITLLISNAIDPYFILSHLVLLSEKYEKPFWNEAGADLNRYLKLSPFNLSSDSLWFRGVLALSGKEIILRKKDHEFRIQNIKNEMDATIFINRNINLEKKEVTSHLFVEHTESLPALETLSKKTEESKNLHFIAFNTRNKTLRDIHARRFISDVLNKNKIKILESLEKDSYKKASSFVSNIEPLNISTEVYKTNEELELTYPEGVYSKIFIENLKNVFKQNAQLNVKPVPIAKELYEEMILKKANYDAMALVSINLEDPFYLFTIFHRTSIPLTLNQYKGFNIMYWYNVEVNELLDHYYLNTSLEKSHPLLTNIIQKISDNAPAVPLYWKQNVHYFSKNFKMDIL